MKKKLKTVHQHFMMVDGEAMKETKYKKNTT